MFLPGLRGLPPVRRIDAVSRQTTDRLIEQLEDRLLLSATTDLPLQGEISPVGASQTVNLNDFFSNPGVDANTVFFNTDFGAIPVELTPSVTPATVANFLSYVDSGAYNDTFIHRSIPGFVWQAGGYTFTTAGGEATIPTNAPVAGEFSQSNVRGTIAMALTDNADGSTDPNSGTDEFFFNLADNSQSLDAQKFTVFGSVINASGLAVMDTIAQQQVVNEGAPFDDLPVVNYTGGSVGGSNLIYIDSITHGFTVISSNPSAVAVSDANSTLTYTAVAPGESTITVTAEGLDGREVDEQFNVTVTPDLLTATVGKGGHKAIQYIDTEGVTTTVSLSGPGSGTLTFEGQGISAGQGSRPYVGTTLDLSSIALTGTTAASTLHIATADNRVVPIGGVSSTGSLSGIIGPDVQLTGNTTIAGTLGTVQLVATQAGSTLSAKSINRMKITDFADGDVTVTGALSSLTVGKSLSGTITASKVNTVEAQYLQYESVVLSGTGTSLGALRAGSAQYSTIFAAGNISTVLLPGGTTDTQIYAGISGAQGISSTAAALAGAGKGTISSITIGRGSVTNAFADSAVAAGTLRHVSTGELDDSAPSSADFYGIAAQKIVSFRGYVAHHALSLANPSTEAQLKAQLAKRKLTLTNLTIEIV